MTRSQQMTEYQRFWSKVDKSGECWIWTAAKTGKGYGHIRLLGKDWLAHRFSYVVEVGGIPAGMLVCHPCDNPACVRPDHLFVGSNRDNTIDMTRKGRGKHAVLNGEQNGQAKITREVVLQIRADSRSGLSHREIAQKFGISQPHVSNVVNVRKWKSIS